MIYFSTKTIAVYQDLCLDPRELDLLRSAVDFDLDPIVEVVERRVAIDRKPLAGGLGLGAVQHRNLDIRIVLVLPGQVVPRRCKVLRERKY